MTKLNLEQSQEINAAGTFNREPGITIRGFSQCVSEMIPEIHPHFYICYAQIVFRKALKDSKWLATDETEM
jgi:hypothetical protein